MWVNNTKYNKWQYWRREISTILVSPGVQREMFYLLKFLITIFELRHFILFVLLIFGLIVIGIEFCPSCHKFRNL